MHISSWLQRVDLAKEIQEVYIHSFLFKLAVRLVAIFLPLYILDLGFGLMAVFQFFLIFYFTYILMSVPHASLASRIGYKHTSLLASPLILVFYLLLRSSPGTQIWVYSAALLGGIGFNMYWMGMNPEIATSSHREVREKETGYFFSMPSIASIVSPFLGGVILAVFDFRILFTFTAVLVGGSFLPFLFSKEHHSGMEMRFLEFVHGADVNEFLTFMMKGVNSVGKKVLWPLYLAVIIQSSLDIGGAGSLLSLGSALSSIGIGKIANDKNRGKVIIGGVVVASISYLGMSQVATSGLAFLVSLFNGLGYTAISIPIYSKAIDHSEESDIIEYFALREIALSVGRISVILALLILFSFLPQNTAFIGGFTLMALAVLITGFFGNKME